jgi:hypothetical protein
MRQGSEPSRKTFQKGNQELSKVNQKVNRKDVNGGEIRPSFTGGEEL